MTTTVEVNRELTLQDRCDNCSAAARVVATFLNGELMFCGHHARKHASSLTTKSATLFDPFNELRDLNTEE